MQEHYDVIVIGSGPAGSTAAYILGSNDIDTLLIEKRELPRHKTCGGGLTNKTMRLLKRVFDRDPDELRDSEILNFDTIDCRVGFQEETIKTFESYDDVFFTDRKEYDYFLFQEAASTGIDTLIGDGVSDINFSENQLNTDSGESISFGHLMAADGVHSNTRKALMERDDISCP
ncbi:MAG: FAD-dependent monooxygenase, partial [bacterium]